MSKPKPADGFIPQRTRDEQIRIFLDAYRDQIDSGSYARVKQHARELGLDYPDDELGLIAALDTPDKVQDFLNTQVYYNNDHASIELEETAMPPRRVLQTGLAHCFEGALFAYAVNFLHDYNPRLVLLEAVQDSEHNLVVWRDAKTGLYGCNAHSGYPNLDGRAAKYPTLRAVADSYYPHYYSDYTLDQNDLTLVGYSDEFDLAKFGNAWMSSEDMQWDLYYTYVDDAVRFHYFSEPHESHLYPTIRALKEKWIEIDAQNNPSVNVMHLPQRAQELWRAFWHAHGESEKYSRPHGEARRIEQEFFRITGTTPIDLADNTFDFQFFLQSGYRVENLFSSKQ